MKTKSSSIIMVLFVSSLLLAACGNQDQAGQTEPKVNAQDLKEESKEALDTAVAYAEQKKEAYRQQIEAELKAFDLKVDKLKDEAMGLKDEARDEYNQQIALLEQKKRSASEKYNTLKSASGEAWNDVTSGMDKAVNELRDGYEKVIAYSREQRIEIPEGYQTASKTEMVSNDKMEWQRILSETNMSSEIVTRIQSALLKAGHDPGPIDGIMGQRTNAAIKSYQKEKRLKVGALDYETIQSLGIEMGG